MSKPFWFNDPSNIYPLTIIGDRYTGVYSRGRFTAWNLFPEELPEAIDDGDSECHNFWESFNGLVGKGNTPDDALVDLWVQMRELEADSPQEGGSNP